MRKLRFTILQSDLDEKIVFIIIYCQSSKNFREVLKVFWKLFVISIVEKGKSDCISYLSSFSSIFNNEKKSLVEVAADGYEFADSPSNKNLYIIKMFRKQLKDYKKIIHLTFPKNKILLIMNTWIPGWIP